MQMGNTDWVKFILDRFIWFIILGVFLFFTVSAKNFLTPLNMINISLHASVLGLMVIGQAICLISGNFDLSAEGTVAHHMAGHAVYTREDRALFHAETIVRCLYGDTVTT